MYYLLYYLEYFNMQNMEILLKISVLKHFQGELYGRF